MSSMKSVRIYSYRVDVGKVGEEKQIENKALFLRDYVCQSVCDSLIRYVGRICLGFRMGVAETKMLKNGEGYRGIRCCGRSQTYV